ncbi:kinase-like protein [Artomyces pyxidatus]|uniref:Kinase-like protein n=1 Tax=Artomyces pyxidatus TaxID=48021 RepID=A0ACB8T4Z5_9AGAM|nr:kinase-like protein [Artomyces pyxidatus]
MLRSITSRTLGRSTPLSSTSANSSSLDQFIPAPEGVLNSCYLIKEKLGEGFNSTVWLATHTKSSSLVAVKIVTASVTRQQGDRYNELQLLRRIKSVRWRSRHPGCDKTLTLLNNFYTAGGHHLCIVTELLGTSLNTVRKYYEGKKLPAPLLKPILGELLSALDFLHRKCKIVHTDIKFDNILFTANIGPSNLRDIPINNVKLIDFGAAASCDGKHADVIQPFALRAPEVIIRAGWGPSADIWNLGCLVYELLTGRWLFCPERGENYNAEQDHLAQMEAMMSEEFPKLFVVSGKRSPEFFDVTANSTVVLRVKAPDSLNIEDSLKAYGDLPEEELTSYVSLLQSMLRLRPLDRLTAKKLLEDRWLMDI